MIFKALLIVQVATFLGLCVYFYAHHGWRMGTAQLLLAGVQAIIYSGRMA